MPLKWGDDADVTQFGYLTVAPESWK